MGRRVQASSAVLRVDGGPTEQLADLEGLISQGVDAIILNPTDREGLNAVLEAAIAQGIVVVAGAPDGNAVGFPSFDGPTVAAQSSHVC